MKKSMNLISIAVGGVLVFILLMQWNIQFGRANEAYRLLADTTTSFNLERIQTGEFINRQDQRIVSLQGAVAAGLVRESELKARGLKRVSTIIRLENEIKRLNLQLEYDTPPEIIYITDTAEVGSNYLKIPQGFNFKDEWTELRGTINFKITIDSITMLSKPTIYLGYQKQGFFKPLKPVVVVEDANPYLTTIAMQNVVIIQKPPFYKTAWWHRGEGAIALGVLTWLVNK